MDSIRTLCGLAAMTLVVAMTAVAMGQELPSGSWRATELQGGQAEPPLPSSSDHPIQLVLDDNSPESAFGVGAVEARQFLWFQQFEAPMPNFTLEEIWVLFPSDPEVVVGAPIQLVVYRDPDGDPSTGAQVLWSSNEVVRSSDGTTFSIYGVEPALEFQGGGDILIGVVNRFVASGVSPLSLPAVLDTSSSSGRSWLATWATDPPDPPTLPGDESQFLIDSFVPGNWMIRGFGQGGMAPIPMLGPGMLASLVASIAALGFALIRWRR